MKSIQFLIFQSAFLFFGSSSLADEILPSFPGGADRMLCNTITQAQQVRVNRCRNGEVMTGIQSLEPLMVYCTTLMANCQALTKSEEIPSKE